MNPFSTSAIAIDCLDMIKEEAKVPHLELVPERESLNAGNEFLSDLRDFMNDFAATDLNIDSIEEPRLMTKEQANFYVKLFQQVVNEEIEVNALCDAELERTTRSINAFRDKKLVEINRKKEHFVSILQQYAASELEGKKTKTLKLPYGNLSFKKQQPKYNYGCDEELVLALKESRPDLVNIKTTESVNKTLLKKEGTVFDGKLYLGEFVVPGVTVQEQEPKFEIK